MSTNISLHFSCVAVCWCINKCTKKEDFFFPGESQEFTISGLNVASEALQLGEEQNLGESLKPLRC